MVALKITDPLMTPVGAFNMAGARAGTLQRITDGCARTIAYAFGDPDSPSLAALGRGEWTDTDGVINEISQHYLKSWLSYRDKIGLDELTSYILLRENTRAN